jgi:hypothetical protein
MKMSKAKTYRGKAHVVEFVTLPYDSSREWTSHQRYGSRHIMVYVAARVVLFCDTNNNIPGLGVGGFFPN